MPHGGALGDNIVPISRHTLADRVYADVKELVLSGQIAPGEKLTLRALASALGTSPMPVRDAVVRLVADRALDMLPNRTVHVSWPSRERFEEISLIRCSLEGQAAELAAERRTDADLLAIRRHAEEFDRLVDGEPPDEPNAIRANRLLHFAVYDAARSPILREMIEALWLQLGPVMTFSIADALGSGARWWDAPNAASDGNQPRWHEDLCDALERRDGKAARRAIVGDIREGSLKIIQSGRLAEGPDTRP